MGTSTRGGSNVALWSAVLGRAAQGSSRKGVFCHQNDLKLTFCAMFRQERDVVRCASLHPAWGAERIAAYCHSNMVKALLNRPPGAKVEVFNFPWALYVFIVTVTVLKHPCTVQVPHRMSHDTVTRILREAGFRSVRPARVPLLSATNKRKRLLFAKRHLKYQHWGKVIFSDEMIFTVRPGSKVRRWIPRNANKFSPKYAHLTVAHPEKVMVWAAMDSSGAICLRRCPEKVKAKEYQDILTSSIPFIRRRYVSFLERHWHLDGHNPQCCNILCLVQSHAIHLPTRWSTTTHCIVHCGFLEQVQDSEV